jgi:hypothetical protein
MARLFTQNILDTECIGDSLVTINNNSQNLDTAVQELSGKVRTFTLSQDNTYYVNSSTSTSSWQGTVTVNGGNDNTADGSPTAPFRTLSACAEFFYNKKDLGGGGLTIRLCPGSYRGAFFRGPSVGANTTTPGFNTAIPGIENPIVSWHLSIVGSNQADTFINQYKEGTFWSGSGINWRHLNFERMHANVQNVTFRYNPSIDPIEGTDTILRTYNMVTGNYNSYINVNNVTFESAPDILAGLRGQTTNNFTVPELISIGNKSYLNLGNITIDNRVNGVINSSTNATGRIFLSIYNHSLGYLYGTLTLSNSPKFNVIFYVGAYGRLIQEAVFWSAQPLSEQFNWSGSFGTRIGTNNNEAFGTDNFRKSNIGNYLVFNDLYSSISVRSALPGNALPRVRSAANDATIYTLYSTW